MEEFEALRDAVARGPVALTALKNGWLGFDATLVMISVSRVELKHAAWLMTMSCMTPLYSWAMSWFTDQPTTLRLIHS